jgi:hypothetical protein
MTSTRGLNGSRGHLTIVPVIFTFPFRSYKGRFRFGLSLGGLWNNRLLPLDAERVRTLRPPISLFERFSMLGRGREFS